MTAREIRPCVDCGQHDDDPRAQHVHPDGVTMTLHHYACHAAADPTCELCAPIAASAAGRTGDALRAHLEELRGA